MIVEFKRNNNEDPAAEGEAIREFTHTSRRSVAEDTDMTQGTFSSFIDRHRETHFQLRDDLMEDLWQAAKLKP
ncbi:unnamed protein product [Mucor hiemalis]